MAFGNSGMGGAYYSGNYNEDLSPKMLPPTPLQEAMFRARDFGTQTTYNLPNGKTVTHVMDPFTGQIRQLIDENRAMAQEERMGLQAYQSGLQQDAMKFEAALKRLMRPHPGIVG